MLKDITIGQYVDTGSVLHRMEPRTKIILLFILIILLFCADNPLNYLIFFGVTAGLTLISKIPIKFILRGMKPMLFILLFTVILNLFLTPGESLVSVKVFSGWTVNITYEGIKLALLMFSRLSILVIISSLLTLTTSPMLLTDGIEKLLRPLTVVKVPAHEIAMMMTIAIRFIPTLAEEADKIMKAQTARGADFESGNLIERVKALIPLLVPLFISAFRRADDLAVAMDARCYRGGKNRTKMREIKPGKADFAGILLIAVIAVAVIVLEYI